MQKRTLYLFTLVLLIWFGALQLSSQFGVLNVDEAWYLTASHLVFNGQIPYRDFAFTQGPVLPYVYGTALWVFGTSLATGRFVSVALATLALALVLNVAHRMAGRRAALLAFVLLLATPSVLYYLALVKTYSLVVVLTLWALALALHSGPAPSARQALLGTVVAGLAVMTRISFLPVLGLVFLYWIWRGRGRSSALGLMIVGAIVLALAASSNGNMLFDVLQFYLAAAPPKFTRLPAKTALGLETAIKFAPALALAVFLLILWWRVPAFRTRLVEWWRTEIDTKLLFLLVAMALSIVNFVASGSFHEHQIPGYFPLVVVLAAMSVPLTHGKDQSVRTLLLAVCVVVSSAPAWIFWTDEVWRPTNTLVSARKASEVLAQRGRPGDTLLGGFNHLALASGLEVYPGNEMGLFSVADGSSPAETTFRHLLSKEAVTDALEGCSPTFVAIYPYGLFPLSVPSIQEIAGETQGQWIDLLRDQYRVIYNDGEVRILERIMEKCNRNAH